MTPSIVEPIHCEHQDEIKAQCAICLQETIRLLAELAISATSPHWSHKEREDYLQEIKRLRSEVSWPEKIELPTNLSKYKEAK